MAYADIYVVPADEGWAVEAAGGGKRTMYATQDEPIQACTERAKADKVELLITVATGERRQRWKDRSEIPGPRNDHSLPM